MEQRIDYPGLIPCPFCGEAPVMNEGPNASKVISYWVSCDNHDCPIAVSSWMADTPKVAARYWNKRFNLTEQKTHE